MNWTSARDNIALLLGSGVAATFVTGVTQSDPFQAVTPAVLAGIATLLASLYGNIASSRMHDRENVEQLQQKADRNHHLRLGFAAAFRKALAEVRRRLPDALSGTELASLFDAWDVQLSLATAVTIDHIIPPLSESPLFDASSQAADRSLFADSNAGDNAISELLTDWFLGPKANLRPAAVKLVPQILKAGLRQVWLDEFHRNVIADNDNFLFKAFVVNGHNQLLREIQGLKDHTTSEIDRAISTLAPHIRPANTPRPEDWTQPPVFVSRTGATAADLLSQIAMPLIADRPRPVAVVGPPGSGKSTLCEQFAWTHRDRFPGGYARLRLDPFSPDTRDTILDALCDRFGIRGQRRTLVPALAQTLREGPALIHIENADGPDTAKAIFNLVRDLPGTAILISGRQMAMGLTGTCTRVEVGVLTEAQAFRQLSEELGSQPASQPECDAWSTLFIRVGHLPLAIHLAAGALGDRTPHGTRRTRTVEEILPTLLSLAPRDPADPVAGLRTAFSLSFRLFEKDPRRASFGAGPDLWTMALCRFAAAPLSGVSKNLGAAICDVDPPSWLDLMEAAWSFSLAVQDFDAGEASAAPVRYRLHPLLREFLAEKNREASEDARQVLSAWFQVHVREGTEVEEQNARWQQVHAEQPALSSWLENLEANAAQAVVSVGNLYARRHGPWFTWRAAALRGATVEDDFNGWADSMFVASELSRSLGALDQSWELAEKLHVRALEEGQLHYQALAAGKVADILQARGDLDEALRIRREEELPVYEKLGDIRERAVTMGKVADILQARGDLDEALRIRREEELPVYEKLGDIRSRAVTMGQVADILQARGDLDEALRIRREEELPVYEKLGDIRERAVTMGKVADILQARGDLDEALRIRREEELPVYEKLGDIRERAVTMGKVADILQARGDLDEALRIRREEELPVYEKLGDIRSRSVTMGQVADILQARGDLDEALRIRREEELPVYEKLGDIRSRAVTMGKVADILQARGDLDEALRIRREEQLPVYEKLGDIRSRAVTMGKVADILQARGDLDEALRIRREEELPVYEKLGDIRERAVTMGKVADILQARGDLDEALRIRREEQLPVYEKLGDIRERAVTMGKVADILQARGDLDETLRIRREEELPVYEKLGDIRSRAMTMGKVADILQARGDLDEALRIRREEQLPVYEKLGDIRSRAICLANLAIGIAMQGDLAEAARILDADVTPALERLNDRVELISLKLLQAQIEAARQMGPEARLLAGRALVDAEALRLPVADRIREFLRTI